MVGFPALRRRTVIGGGAMTNLAKTLASDGDREIRVTNWQPCERDALIGFLSLTLPSGMTIHCCSIFQEAGKRWLGLPSSKSHYENGWTIHSPVITFDVPDDRDRFHAAALDAVDRFLAARDE
jgi:hypothetical protein